MASNLTDQVRSISEVTKAVALGDLSRTVNVDVQGEMLDLKMTVNQMVAQLSTLANEVTRVSLEVALVATALSVGLGVVAGMLAGFHRGPVDTLISRVLRGNPPSAVAPPSGCRFHTRCSYATKICGAVEPQLVDHGGGHVAARHHPLGATPPAAVGARAA